MRYKSPPAPPKNNQDSLQEKAARHHRIRQSELQSLPDSEERADAHRAKVLEKRAKHGESRASHEEVNRTVARWLFPLSPVKRGSKEAFNVSVTLQKEGGPLLINQEFRVIFEDGTEQILKTDDKGNSTEFASLEKPQTVGISLKDGWIKRDA